MEKLGSGEFFGETGQKLDMEGFVLTNTVYTHDYVDWHHHENAYFTFILCGSVIEGNKKGKTTLSAGGLLYHNAQESHYNIKPKGETRGMHLEIRAQWLDQMYPTEKIKEGSFEIGCHKTRLLFYKILKEGSSQNDLWALGFQQLVIEAMGAIVQPGGESVFPPSWIKAVTELLQDTYTSPPSLKAIAEIAGVHPVHLSRSFSRYLGCTMAEYVRGIKVERALSKLSAYGNQLGRIAHETGFADQSHMTRCFKEISGATPSFFRKLMAPSPKG
jgi:AraC family transcriptional regulator